MGWLAKVSKFKETVNEERVNRSRLKITNGCIHGEEGCVRCASEEFEAQTDVSCWQNLDDLDIKRVVKSLPEKVRTMMRMHPGKVVVAGGFIRAIVSADTPHDIDIFIDKESNANDWTTEVDLSFKSMDMHLLVTNTKDANAKNELQIIWRYKYTEPYQIIDQFDFTVVKAAIWFDEGDKDHKPNFVGICHERFYRDLARKLLVYICDKDAERPQSLQRLLKYAHYGYVMEPKSLAEMFVKICLSLKLEGGFQAMLAELEECYVATSSETEWAGMTKKYVKPKEKPRDYYSGS